MSTAVASSCWQCGQRVSCELFCASCNALQPPPRDYYALLGIDRKLTLSDDDLQRRFYELSRLLHPDRYMRKSEAERRYSLEASSILNDANRTLRDPVKRAEYILTEEGFDVAEQRSKDVPAELLEEVFELNMALEEMRGGDESARPQLEAARDNFAGMLEETGRDLTGLFATYDAAPQRETLGRIRGVLNRRRYIQNLVNEVEKELAKSE